MSTAKLAVVTATLDAEKTRAYWGSWTQQAKKDISIVVVRPAEEGEVATEPKIQSFYRTSAGEFEATVITPGIVGVVPAFAAGVKAAADLGAEIIACFHDDLRIDEGGWDEKVTRWFDLHERCGLAGFYGAKGLGAGDIYQTPYNPMQLARSGGGSNMVEAEKHGERWLEPKRVVCFDGFSQIGRAELMKWAFERLMKLGVVHHMYDGALGAFAIELGWECWFLPIACHHAGGMTAVANEEYQRWAKEKDPRGDQAFWEESHRIIYEELRGLLPLWVSE